MIVVNACSIPPRLVAGIDGARTMAGHRIPPSVDQAINISGVSLSPIVFQHLINDRLPLYILEGAVAAWAHLGPRYVN